MDDRGALADGDVTVLGCLTVPARPDQVGQARGLIARLIGRLHPRAADAALLTSELVTNAVLHSDSALPGGTVAITVLRSAGGLRVEVADSGSELSAPVVRVAADAAGGHGLFLVQKLSDRWGYLRDESGTTVWFWLAA